MKKSNIASAVALALGAVSALASLTAQAQLTNGSVMTIDAGVRTCNDPSNCPNGGTHVSSGSWFGMDRTGDLSIDDSEKTIIAQGTQGIIIGITQGPGAHHSGYPTGSDTNLIDAPWGFFCNTGSDFTTKAITQYHTDTGATKFMDFSGWSVTWSGVSRISMGTGGWNAGTGYANGGNGVAEIVCSDANCDGTYTLDYFAVVPNDGQTSFGGVHYQLHLEGTVIPAPAPSTVDDTATVTPNPSSVAIDVTANDNASGTTIDKASVTIGTVPTQGTTSINTTTGVITYTPNAGLTFPGASTTDTFTYTVSSLGGATSSPATVTVTLTNAAPVVSDLNTGTYQDTDTPIDILAQVTDDDNPKALSDISIVSAPTHGALSAINVAAGTVSYKSSPPNYTGPDSFTYTVKDSHGVISNTGTVSLTVALQGSNIAPTASSFSASTPVNTPTNLDVTTHVGDPDASPVDLSTTAVASGPTHGTLVNHNNGTFTYTPDLDYGNNTDSFTYTVNDTLGVSSAAGTVTLTLTDQAPVAADDSATTLEDTAILINVTGNDTDTDGTLDKTKVFPSVPAHGTATADATTGVVTYTPATDYTGPDSFTYTVQDNNGVVSNAATVTLTVSAPTPTASSGTLSGGTQGGAADGTAPNLALPDSGVTDQCVGGCFDFQVTGVSTTVMVTLPLTAVLPGNAVYRVYVKGAWQDLVLDANNKVASAQGVATSTGPAVCPAPGSSDSNGVTGYRTGLTAGDRCVQLTLQDGGPNDALVTADGIVPATGGIGVDKVSPGTSSSSSGGGCSLSTVPVSAGQRGDWWVVTGVLTWLGAVRRKLQ